VKGPKLVYGHRFEIIRFHFLNPDEFVVIEGSFRLRANFGNSGPVQWSRAAKTECPDGNKRQLR